MASYRVIFNDSLAHKANYQGGFIKKNGRVNNSPEYNHNYYEENKENWPKYPSQQPDKGKINAPSENKGGKMSNGMPSDVRKKTSSATDVHALLKSVAERHAKIESSGIADDEPAASGSGSGSGRGKKGSGGGKGKSSAAKETKEKTEKPKKESAKKSSESKDDDKKKKEEEEKRKAEEAKKKKEEEEKKKADPIDSDESLSDKEKQMYKGISNMAEKSGQSIQDYVENEGFDALFAKYFPGEIDPKEPGGTSGPAGHDA